MPLALPLQARNIGVNFLFFYSHLPPGPPPPLRPDMKTNCLSGLDTILLLAVFNFFSPPLSPTNNLGSTTSLCSWLISFTRPSSLAWISLLFYLSNRIPENPSASHWPDTQVCRGCPHHPEIQFFWKKYKWTHFTPGTCLLYSCFQGPAFQFWLYTSSYSH